MHPRRGRTSAVLVAAPPCGRQPVTTLEGLAAGTALLLSGIGGLPEVLGGVEGDRSSPRHQIDALARSLGQLVDDHAANARGAHTCTRNLDADTSPAAVARSAAVYANAQTLVPL
jgi:hypothetical protein